MSISTIPNELREAATIFRLNPWLRFKTVELPFAALGLIWNSMMSWAGGWFFLMASEIFTVGSRDFRLPGIGAYLQTAASAGNLQAVTAGIVTLVLTIIVLDQLIWCPVLAWAEKFKLEMEPAIGRTDGELLELRSIYKTYGKASRQFVALQDINSRISAGEFVCLLGPSG